MNGHYVEMFEWINNFIPFHLLIELVNLRLFFQAEQISLHGFINMFLVISLAILWALLPTDLLAIGVQWVQNRILDVRINFNY